MRTAVVTIATGAYIAFAADLIESLASAPGGPDEVFVLTDDASSLSSGGAVVDGVTVTYLPWGAMPWPYPTLWRFAAIASYEALFRARVTHLLYTDVDMRMVGDIAALFGPTLVAVQHPGYADARVEDLPFCRDSRSRAHFVPSQSSRYVCGGVQGGNTDSYLAAVLQCGQEIQYDFLDNVMAQWHDESHWNRYVNARLTEVEIFDTEYCWPEEIEPPPTVHPRILALQKDHHALRGTRPTARDRLRKSRLGTLAIRTRRHFRSWSAIR